MFDQFSIFELVSNRCPHCGMPVIGCSLYYIDNPVTDEIFYDAPPVCMPCYETHDIAYWRDWIAKQSSK